jgi:hypothetical protein
VTVKITFMILLSDKLKRKRFFLISKVKELNILGFMNLILVKEDQFCRFCSFVLSRSVL